MVPIIPIIGAIATVAGLGIDWWISDNIEDSVSQFESLLMMIETGGTFMDFLSDCWLVLLAGGFVFWLGLDLAFPKRRRGSRA